MIIFRLFDFLVDYFTHLTARKIVGGILAVLGLAMISKLRAGADPNSAILYAIGGIIVGGVGAVIIYYDMAKDKMTPNQDLPIVAKAHEHERHESTKAATWHMDQESDEKTTHHNK